jgi:uncharacterized glyoxalase superfamily protein PhnB
MEDTIRLRQLVPTFHVRDVQAAADWYRDRMGWDIEFVAAPHYGGVVWQGHVLHLSQWQQPIEMPHSQAYVMLNSGVDDYFAQLKRAGVEPYNGPTDQPYGMREFNVRDLDGNYLHVGQPLAASA